MASIQSPFSEPLADWQFARASLEVPVDLVDAASLRFSGRELPAIRVDGVVGNQTVKAPFDGPARLEEVQSGGHIAEVQFNPFRSPVARHIRFGCPTFYLFFPPGSQVSSFAPDGVVSAGDNVGPAVTGVTVAWADQHGIALPWVDRLALMIAALEAAGESPDGLEQLRSHLESVLDPTLWLLDHSGQPVSQADLHIVIRDSAGTQQSGFDLSLSPQDNGDIAAGAARVSASDSSVPADLRAAIPPGGALEVQQPSGNRDYLFVDPRTAEPGTSTYETEDAHAVLLWSDLHDWFAPQSVSSGPDGLARFTRGNEFRGLVEGHEYFADLFVELERAAQAPDGGANLAGWWVDAESNLIGRPPGDDPNFPRDLRTALSRINDAGGSASVLGSRFIQLSGGGDAAAIELTALLLLSSVGFVTLMDHISPTGYGLATNPIGMAVVAGAALGVGGYATYTLMNNGENVEPNEDALELLEQIGGSVSANFSGYPARFADNPLAPPTDAGLFDIVHDVTQKLGVYHQKFAIVKNAEGWTGYCGGIDLNPNRLDDEQHLGPFPYHDVQARIDGPAVRDLALSFDQRWQVETGQAPALEAPLDASTLPATGQNAVQVGRTYFQPSNSNTGLDFAPQGDDTIARTLISAVESAQRYIYIEDQYFSPPKSFRDAVLQKVQDGDVARVIFTIPAKNDQLFGDFVGDTFIQDLVTADDDRGIVKIRSPRRRYTVPGSQTTDPRFEARLSDLTTSRGKLYLTQSATSSASTVHLGPSARIPPPPFWIAINGELMVVADEDVGQAAYQVLRGPHVGFEGTSVGPMERAHPAGSPALVVELSNIYVHSKLMLVDDVFASVGSANLNRRGFYHDGEINVFTVPETLRASQDNPVATLRKRLWAHWFDLPYQVVEPLLRDPIEAADLMDRTFLHGNRLMPHKSGPSSDALRFAPGSTFGMLALQALGYSVVITQRDQFFDGLVDPTSSLDPNA